MRMPRSVLLYIILAVLAALAVAALCLRSPFFFSLTSLWLFALLSILAVLSVRFGLHLTHGINVHVDNIPFLTAVLVLDPPLACGVAVIGVVVGGLWRRKPALELIFNAAQSVLYVGTGALVINTLYGTPWQPASARAWGVLVVTALGMYVLNTVLVAGIVSLQQGVPFRKLWLGSLPLDLIEQSIMSGFGLLAALVVVPYPWALLLMALPSVAVFIILDRTLKMEAQQTELAKQNADLAAHLSQQAEQLRDAYAVLEDALDSQNQLLQNVSHELRTPMVSVSGYTEALRDGLYGSVSPEQGTALDVIWRNTQRMIRLVNNLLTLQALDRGHIEPGVVFLLDMLRGCAETFAQRAVDAGVHIAVLCSPDLPPLRADESRLEQVIGNLLDNAIKFSPNGGEVVVEARHPREGTVTISVSDHGIGIPADELRNIYRRFYQVDGSKTRRFGGQGLGLAIAKRIVELHGGSISAESEVARGTTFLVTLPCSVAVAGVGRAVAALR